VQQLPASLASGKTAILRIQMNTQSAGPKSGSVSFATNDTNEDPFSFPLFGTVEEIIPLLPEINVVEATDGQSEPVSFGTVQVGSTLIKSFTVHNSGSAPLTLGQPNAPAGFEIVGKLPPSLRPGDTATFQIRMNTDTPGPRTGELTLINGDSDENPYNFKLAGEVVSVPPPEIIVSMNGVAVQPSEALKVGTALVNSDPGSISIEIGNNGGSDLLVSNWTLPAGFRLVSSSSLPSRITPGQTKTVQLKLITSTVGVKTGTLSFSTNDSDESQYSITLSGKVYPPVTIVSGTPSPTDNGTYTIHVVTRRLKSVTIDPAHGPTAFGGRYIITLEFEDGGPTRTSIDSTLSRVEIHAREGDTFTIDNWTSVSVEIKPYRSPRSGRFRHL
jgi:hypothetical protein